MRVPGWVTADLTAGNLLPQLRKTLKQLYSFLVIFAQGRNLIHSNYIYIYIEREREGEGERERGRERGRERERGNCQSARYQSGLFG